MDTRTRLLRDASVKWEQRTQGADPRTVAECREVIAILDAALAVVPPPLPPQESDEC